ncbi:MAG: TIGR03936 family radical SAM-associated protein, partial [Clostridiales bacterium]
MNRWRVKMSVEGPLAWLSHLDLLTALERAIRRADLPIRYSEGFNPHMIISWGPAHPVGLASLGEYLDLDFQDSPQDDWQQKLNQYLPMGLSIREARKIPFDMPSLMAAINIAVYQVDLGE